MVKKGTSWPCSPVESNRSGFVVINISNPSITLPSPIAISPKTGINSPPIIKPIAFILSDTATAFNPPKTAYTEPIRPIPQIQDTNATSSEMLNIPGISNIPLIATDPEYKITGSSTTTYPVKKSPEVSVLVVTSNLSARNWGTVVSPPFKYLGNKSTAVTTMAIAAKVSHAITDNPSLYALPLSPTICSVERFVNKSEPAMTPAVRLLPPKK